LLEYFFLIKKKYSNNFLLLVKIKGFNVKTKNSLNSIQGILVSKDFGKKKSLPSVRSFILGSNFALKQVNLGELNNFLVVKYFSRTKLEK